MARLPHDEYAEKNLLGSMLMSEEAIADVIELVNESDFYFRKNSTIFKAIKNLFTEGKQPDIITVASSLGNELKDIGGHEYLASVTQEPYTTANAKQYANIIRKQSVLRKLIAFSNETITRCNTSMDPASVLTEAQQKLFEISQANDTRGVSRISDIAKRTLQEIRELKDRGEYIPGIKTGFYRLDSLISGLSPGELIIVAARPSVGKSALACNMAQNMAMENNKSVMVFSLEMSSRQIVNRILSSEAVIQLPKITSGMLKDYELLKIERASEAISDSGLVIDDKANITAAEIFNKARRQKMFGKLDVIFVDYLQLISGGDNKESRYAQVTAISRALKVIAKELDVPVVALSQLSRNSEMRGGRPRLSDLRDSGAIEQDADKVMFIHRPDNGNKSLVEIIVEKNRQGRLGSVDMWFKGDYTKFYEKDKQ